MFDSPYVLLDDSRAGRTRLFERPHKLFVAHTRQEAIEALDELADALQEGLHVAGFASYELGYVLEERLVPLLTRAADMPLLAMGAFGEPRMAQLSPHSAAPATIVAAQPRWQPDAYEHAFDKVMDYIAAGDTYQINLTFPIDLMLSGSPLDFYLLRRTSQPTPYGAVVSLAGPQVISFSPELFFQIADGRIRTRPMKGTTRRGRDKDEDMRLAAELARDIKQRAENLMIVDLLRNDISRICAPGSVHVPDLFTVETYPTLHTMVSTVEGRLTPGVSPAAVFRALFPCGSVTGAPKLRAMEIIAETEPWPRGAYCGAIGAFAPDGSAEFNVSIRTMTVFDDGSAVYSVGGGVVADSTAQMEFDECMLKAKFLLG